MSKPPVPSKIVTGRKDQKEEIERELGKPTAEGTQTRIDYLTGKRVTRKIPEEGITGEGITRVEETREPVIVTRREEIDPELDETIQRYAAGEDVSRMEARRALYAALEQMGVTRMERITKAPEGYYYRGEDVQQYNIRVREYNVKLSEYRRQLFEELTEQREKALEGREEEETQPLSRTFTDITSIGPPKTATRQDVMALREEGYELPSDKTIYVDPSGKPFYYEEEVEPLKKALSMKLYEKAQETPVGETGEFLGLKYRKRSLYETQAIVVGSVESGLTPILSLIPGEQPLELMPEEVGISFRDVDKFEKKRVALLAGVFTEATVSFGVSAGVGYVGGVGIGAVGATISRTPIIGGALTTAGVRVASILNTPIGKTALSVSLVTIEGIKAKKTLELTGKPSVAVGQTFVDLSGMLGLGAGLSEGISYGKQLPAKLEKTILGGVTIREEQIVPEAVRTGKSGFPSFKDEPYAPTANGYREMAETYTPEELRITEKGVSSYHATPGPLKGKTKAGFVTQIGVRKGESGMFYSPAGSKHFLRLEGGYGMGMGVESPIGEAKWIYGEFPGVTATGLSKTSPELGQVLEKSTGTGRLFMPSEQLEEAQAILAPGTEMGRVPGRFYADMGGKTVKIERYLPTKFAENLGVKVTDVKKIETLATEQRRSMSYIYGKRGTTYLPISSMLGVSKPSKKPSTPSRVYSSVSSALSVSTVSSKTKPSEVSSAPSLKSISSYPSGVSTPKISLYPVKPYLSKPTPSRASPRSVLSVPSKPSGISPPSTPVTIIEPKRRVTGDMGLPNVLKIREPKKRRKRKKRGVAEKRVDPLKSITRLLEI